MKDATARWESQHSIHAATHSVNQGWQVRSKGQDGDNGEVGGGGM